MELEIDFTSPYFDVFVNFSVFLNRRSESGPVFNMANYLLLR